MAERITFFLYKLRYIPVALLIATSLFFLFFFITNLGPVHVRAMNTDPAVKDSSNALSDPNVISGGMAIAANTVGRAVSSAAKEGSNRLQVMASATARGTASAARGMKNGMIIMARYLGRSIAFTAHAAGRGITFVARTVGGSIVFVFQIPFKAVGSISNTHAVNTVIKPAEHSQVPIIDPKSPELLAAREALPAVQTVNQASPEVSPESVWPIHGQITTQFGERGRLYHPVHTGLDISDNQRSGITQVKSFRQGHVVEISRSGGLGNHVIVDHGSGVTSVYGHLASVRVEVGQEVNINTTLGYEGTTGVSTGVHLHFEIRVNGEAADPHLFISGQP